MGAACARAGDRRLVFTLPTTMVMLVPAGRFHPCLHACVVTVANDGRVEISGPSREQVFAQAQRFLSPLTRTLPATTMAAVLFTHGSGQDNYEIIINAGIAFAPTGLGVEVFAREDAPRLPLTSAILPD